MRPFVYTAVVLPWLACAAQGAGLSMSMDEYVQKAIQQGIKGRENALAFESAGYSREIAFRQTDSPSLTLSGSETRTGYYGTFTNSTFIDPRTGVPTAITSTGWTQPTDVGQSSLSLTEPLPTGTILQASGLYGDTVGKPGLNASILQPLYLFVKNPVMRSRERASLTFANAQDTFDSAILAIRTQARDFYYNVMLGEETIQVEQRKVISSNKLLDVTEALVEAGKTAAVETARAKIRVQSDERQLQNAVVNRQKAELAAKNFLQLPLDQPVQFTTRLEFKPFRLSLKRLTDYALLHRPELKTLRRSQDLARLDYEAAREPTRPTLSLNSTYQHTELPSTGVSKNWSLTGNTNWLLFDSYVTDDQTRIARIGLEVAGLNLTDAERTTALNVESTYLDIKRAEKQIVDFQNSREQARRNVDVLRLRFQNGLERLLDVFDAETEMRNLDNEYLGLLVGYNQLLDNLSQLVGADVGTLS